ncbi:MAG: hypothetical protein EOO42_07775 [Flavobacteriales bacterium]|nr:MAG: hypothetical protein EOO42_07775 [Flavobacteriales bacterium]
MGKTNRSKPYLLGIMLSGFLVLLTAKFLCNMIISLNQNPPQNVKDFLILLTVIAWVLLTVSLLYRKVNKFFDGKAIDRLLPYLAVAFLFSFLPELFFAKSKLFNTYVGTQIVYGCNSGDGEAQVIGYSGIAYKAGEVDLAAREAYSEGNCLRETGSFLFWQTAMAQGYLPNSGVPISKFYSFSTFIELAFSLGPIYCIENALKMLLFNLPICLLFFFVMRFGKRSQG